MSEGEGKRGGERGREGCLVQWHSGESGREREKRGREGRRVGTA